MIIMNRLQTTTSTTISSSPQSGHQFHSSVHQYQQQHQQQQQSQQQQEQQVSNVKKGWLSRWTRKQWSRHWFVLKNGSLTYYRGPAAELCNFLDGVLDLSLIKDIELVNDPDRNNTKVDSQQQQQNQAKRSSFPNGLFKSRNNNYPTNYKSSLNNNCSNGKEQVYTFSLKMWNGESHMLAASSSEELQCWLNAIGLDQHSSGANCRYGGSGDDDCATTSGESNEFLANEDEIDSSSSSSSKSSDMDRLFTSPIRSNPFRRNEPNGCSLNSKLNIRVSQQEALRIQSSQQMKEKRDFRFNNQNITCNSLKKEGNEDEIDNDNKEQNDEERKEEQIQDDDDDESDSEQDMNESDNTCSINKQVSSENISFDINRVRRDNNEKRPPFKKRLLYVTQSSEEEDNNIDNLEKSKLKTHLSNQVNEHANDIDIDNDNKREKVRQSISLIDDNQNKSNQLKALNYLSSINMVTSSSKKEDNHSEEEEDDDDDEYEIDIIKTELKQSEQKKKRVTFDLSHKLIDISSTSSSEDSSSNSSSSSNDEDVDDSSSEILDDDDDDDDDDNDNDNEDENKVEDEELASISSSTESLTLSDRMDDISQTIEAPSSVNNKTNQTSNDSCASGIDQGNKPELDEEADMTCELVRRLIAERKHRLQSRGNELILNDDDDDDDEEQQQQQQDESTKRTSNEDEIEETNCDIERQNVQSSLEILSMSQQLNGSSNVLDKQEFEPIIDIDYNIIIDDVNNNVDINLEEQGSTSNDRMEEGDEIKEDKITSQDDDNNDIMSELQLRAELAKSSINSLEQKLIESESSRKELEILCKKWQAEVIRINERHIKELSQSEGKLGELKDELKASQASLAEAQDRLYQCELKLREATESSHRLKLQTLNVNSSIPSIINHKDHQKNPSNDKLLHSSTISYGNKHKTLNNWLKSRCLLTTTTTNSTLNKRGSSSESPLVLVFNSRQMALRLANQQQQIGSKLLNQGKQIQRKLYELELKVDSLKSNKSQA